MNAFGQTFAKLSTKYGRRAAEPLCLFLGIGRTGGVGTSFVPESRTDSETDDTIVSCLRRKGDIVNSYWRKMRHRKGY